jgi:hypothetical protein
VPSAERRARLALTLIACGLMGCESFIGAPPGTTGAGGGDVLNTGGGAGGSGGSGGSGGTGGGGAAAYLSNLDVYTRLKPTCAGCHTIDQRPFFADLASFENLVVYDPRYVRPGDPDGSVLVGLLEGSIGRQMPPLPSDSFKVLDSKGLTQISLQEIKDWIRALPTSPDAGAAFEPVQVRRKTAEQIRVTLYAQLGLSEADFFTTSSTAGIPYRLDANAGDAYAVRSSDATPYADPFDQGGSLYSAMGGAYWLEGKLQNDAITPNMLQALVPISQAWCRAAFEKPSNTAVLAKATLADTSTTGAAAIKANIAYLYLRMLGEPAPQAEVDDLFANVFQPYESKGTKVGWTAVCAALVRDPMWVLY